MTELENIKSKLSGLINDLKYKPQNPAYVITKDDIIDALSEAFDYVDRVSEEDMYDNFELKKIISDAYFDIDDLDSDIYSIKNDLNGVKKNLKTYQKYLDDTFTNTIRTESGVDINHCIEEIDDVISEIEDIYFKIRDIKYDLDY